MPGKSFNQRIDAIVNGQLFETHDALKAAKKNFKDKQKLNKEALLLGISELEQPE